MRATCSFIMYQHLFLKFQHVAFLPTNSDSEGLEKKSLQYFGANFFYQCTLLFTIINYSSNERTLAYN